MIGKLIGVGLLLLVGLGAYGSLTYFQPHQQTVTVQRHFIDSDKSSHYVVVSTNGTLYEVDSPWWKPFDNSVNADANYAKLQDNQTFCFTYAGWYSPAWPMYWYWIVYGVQAGACKT